MRCCTVECKARVTRGMERGLEARLTVGAKRNSTDREREKYNRSPDKLLGREPQRTTISDRACKSSDEALAVIET